VLVGRLARHCALPGLIGALVALTLPAASADVASAQSPPLISTTPGLFPAFDPSISDYVVRCQPANSVTVSVSAPQGTVVSVDNGPAQTGSFTRTVALDAGQAFRVTSTRSAQAAASYHVRCLPSDFPAFTAKRTGPTQAAFFAMTPNQAWPPPGVSRQFAAFFDNNGVPLWWMRSAGTSAPGDLKLLPNGDAIWLHELLSGRTGPGAEEHRLDGSLVRDLNAVGAPGADHHDIQLLPNGNYILARTAARPGVDLSPCGGPTSGSLLDTDLQEITPTGTLVWSWRTSDHIPVSEVAPQWRGLCHNFADVYHWNSIEFDGTGYVVSYRHLNAVYRIDRATGAIDWKLGGTPRPQSLRVVGDPYVGTNPQPFCAQHDARVLPDGSVTLFDDETACARTPRSVRYAIDRNARTATLLESVKNPRVGYSGCCGSTRKLPGGDWVTSWGSARYVTEQSPSGAIVFQLTFTGSRYVYSYRANPVLPGQLTAAQLRAGMDAMNPR
jgi:hypothetical protein